MCFTLIVLFSVQMFSPPPSCLHISNKQYFILLHSSTLLHFRGKYCTFFALHHIVFHYFYVSEESGACFPAWMEMVKCVNHPCLLAAVYGGNYVFCLCKIHSCHNFLSVTKCNNQQVIWENTADVQESHLCFSPSSSAAHKVHLCDHLVFDGYYV